MNWYKLANNDIKMSSLFDLEGYPEQCIKVDDGNCMRIYTGINYFLYSKLRRLLKYKKTNDFFKLLKNIKEISKIPKEKTIVIEKSNKQLNLFQ